MRDFSLINLKYKMHSVVLAIFSKTINDGGSLKYQIFPHTSKNTNSPFIFDMFDLYFSRKQVNQKAVATFQKIFEQISN